MKTPRLKEWREARGETQVTLAERSGVAEHTISRIEHGGSLRPSTARKLANALYVSVADLLERPPVPLDEAALLERGPKFPEIFVASTSPEEIETQLFGAPASEIREEGRKLLPVIRERKAEQILSRIIAERDELEEWLAAHKDAPEQKIQTARRLLRWTKLYYHTLLDFLSKLDHPRGVPYKSVREVDEELGYKLVAGGETGRETVAGQRQG